MKKLIMFMVLLLLILVVGCTSYGATGNAVNRDAAYAGYDSNSGSPPITGKMTGTGHERQCY